MKTRIVWGAGALALLVGAGLVAGELVRRPRPARGVTPATTVSDVQGVRSELDALRSQLASLQTTSRSAGGVPAPTGGPSAAQAMAAPAAGSPEPEPPSREDELAFIDHQFEKEARDATWAEANALGGSVTKLLPPGSSVRSLDCRSSLCRLEMQHADMTAYRTFFDRFILSAGIGGVWKGATSFEVKDHGGEGEPVNVVAYLAREDMPSLAAQ